jgi:hypothetical protein
MLQICDVGFVSRRTGGELLMLHVACNTDHNMVATWGRREETR